MGLEVGGLSSIELSGLESCFNRRGVAAVSTGNLGSEESTADHIQYLSHNGSHDCNNGRLGPGGVGHRAGSVLNLLQIQRNVTLFPPDVIASIFSSAWWVPPCCGTASAVIGLLYPCIDRHLGEPHKFKREWSSVMRCVAVFVGINHASAKVDFDNNIQLSLTLAALSIGLWWTFDRSRSGFGLGVGIAFLATLVTQLLVYNGVYQYTSPDFLYVRSWLPCIFFAGGITMGNIGRQLAMYECKVIAEKSHQE
ncbi:Insulin-induced gene 2 protein [Manis javanica]|nr:Insulin-induced gene 2 protein [Manis javanica]